MTYRSNKQLQVRLALVMLTLLFITVTVTAQAANPALIEAARHQDGEAVRLLLSGGADPDSRQVDDATALHWAVYREDVDMAALLIEAGADINSANRLGTSPLFIAAEAGNA